MLNNEIMSTSFKLGKSVSFLCLFQVLTVIAAAVMCFVLTDLINLFPESILNQHSLGPAVSAAASLYFGYRTEKKHPGMLDKKNIKKISLCFATINYMLMILILSVMLYSKGASQESIIKTGGLTAVLMLFMMILIYYTTRVFISSGIKISRKQTKKLQ